MSDPGIPCSCRTCRIKKRFGIGDEFCFADVQKKFRGQARVCHPDKPGGSTEKFQKLNEAFMFIQAIHEDGCKSLPPCQTIRLSFKTAAGSFDEARESRRREMFRYSTDEDELANRKLPEKFQTFAFQHFKKSQDIMYENQDTIIAFIRKNMEKTKLVGKDDEWIRVGIGGIERFEIWIWFINSTPTKKDIKEFIKVHFNTKSR
jgi:hypothetical protein